MAKNNIEIERKFLVKEIPGNLEEYKKLEIKQGYISIDPVIRLRQQNNKYIFTFKGEGTIVRQEFEYELNEEQFSALWEKVENNKITKTRYLIPLSKNLTAELDIFKENLEGFVNVEVEFSNLDEANDFIPPDWFGLDISEDRRYSNASLSINGIPGK